MPTSAIYIDFDNVFGGLHALDPASARRIAQNPEIWLSNLAERHLLGSESRRWLIRRCYMNPEGSLQFGAERVAFSRFRPFLVRAGFEVVDCPPLTKKGKNAADIRIVLDVMDVLASSFRPDEIVIASSDSDFTPLLHRLRSQDRQITLIATGDAAAAYKSLADQILDAPTLIELLSATPEPEEESVDVESALAAEPVGGAAIGPGEPTPDHTAFDQFALERYTASDGPLNLAKLSTQARQAVGDLAGADTWFGAGSFSAALRRAGLPNVRFSQHYFWDADRHKPPFGVDDSHVLPDTIAQIVAVTDLPALDGELWPPVCAALADYAATHEFNLTESTKWTRDRLSEQGFVVGRNVVAFTMQGALTGGAALTSDPPPTADEIGTAFFGAMLSRAKTAGLLLDDHQVEEMRAWLGCPPAPVVEPDADSA